MRESEINAQIILLLTLGIEESMELDVESW